MSEKSAEEWELADLIADVKLGLPKPGEEKPNGVCPYHGSQTRLLIWIARRLDQVPVDSLRSEVQALCSAFTGYRSVVKRLEEKYFPAVKALGEEVAALHVAVEEEKDKGRDGEDVKVSGEEVEAGWGKSFLRLKNVPVDRVYAMVFGATTIAAIVLLLKIVGGVK